MITHASQTGSLNLLAASLVGWFVLVNALTFLAFFLDQRRTVAGEGAMPEGTLLLLAMVGGWPGAQVAGLVFHAAQRQRRFGTFLNLSILPALALVGVLVARQVDWAALAAQIPQSLGVGAPASAETAAVALPPKPVVRGMAASVPKAASVTDNPSLPKRIGPGSKKAAWQSR